MDYLTKHYKLCAIIAFFLTTPITILMSLDFWQNPSNRVMQRPEIRMQTHELINEVDQNLGKIVYNPEFEQNPQILQLMLTAVNNALKKIADNYASDSTIYYNSTTYSTGNYINAIAFIENKYQLFSCYKEDMIIVLNHAITSIIQQIKVDNFYKRAECRNQVRELLSNPDYTQRMVCIFILLAASYFEPSFVEWAMGALLRYADETVIIYDARGEPNPTYIWRPLCYASLHHLYKFIYQLDPNCDEPITNSILLALQYAHRSYSGDMHDYTTEIYEDILSNKNYYDDSPKPMLATQRIPVHGLPAALCFFPSYKEQTPPYPSNEGPTMSEELRVVLQLNALRKKVITHPQSRWLDGF